MLDFKVQLLVADDSDFSRQQLIQTIENHEENIVIYQAANGKEALNLMRQHDIDIVILDIIMPVMTGIDVLETMRKDMHLRNTTVIMFTSITDRRTLLECFDLGAFDFIEKPLQEAEFKARIKAVMRGKRLEKKSMEYLNTLKKQNQELKDLNKTLGETKVKMVHQEKLAGIGQLAAGVAHEINNPLGYLMSNFETLHEYLKKFHILFEAYEELESNTLEVKDQKIQHILEALKSLREKTNFDFILKDIEEIFDDSDEGLKRIKRIVNGLKNFSRIDTTEGFEPYCVNKGIDDTLTIMQNELKYTTQVVFQKGTIPEIQAVGGEINQVLLNLLINANDAIKEKYTGKQLGNIVIETKEINGCIQVVIEDDGLGISKDQLPHIFNPFYTTKPVGRGTGLGLSIAYDVIQTKHQGSIDVASREGEGSRFMLTLPIVQPKKKILFKRSVMI